MKRTSPWVVAVVLACTALGPWGCAKRGSPPGGPADTTPPYVAGITPSSGSVGVSLDSPISVQFSERMKRRTVETGVIVSPPCRWKKRYWKDNTYQMIPEEGLRAGTTYLVSISNKAEDAHKVKLKSTFVAGFSTGDSIDAGIISGEVRWKRMTVEAAVVELHDAAAIDTAAGFPGAEPLYLTLSGPGGVYEVPFVNTAGRYRVLAFIDKNINSLHDEDEDLGCHIGDVVFGESSELDGVDVTICGDGLRGTIEGRVDTSTVADTLKVSLVATSTTDSTLVYTASPATGGEFEMTCVVPGRYVLEARAVADSIFIELPDTVGVESCSRSRYVEIKFDHED